MLLNRYALPMHIIFKGLLTWGYFIILQYNVSWVALTKLVCFFLDQKWS